MTYQNNFTLSAALLEQLTTSGLDALPTLFQVLLNAAMQIERQNHLGAAPHQRTGHANGLKEKTLTSRLGQITVAVPQVREVNGQGGGFYPFHPPPIKPPAERRCLCAQAGDEMAGRSGHTRPLLRSLPRGWKRACLKA